MKYKRIELLNYAGIYNGMGLNQIKIDFTKCISNKIIIRGANGSGKSTLMSAINPMPDSNDKFIPNAEARKTIILSDNNIDYLIRYIHPITNSGRGTTKGYISKSINGQMVELNPNGNVSSCKDIIYDEFGFDSAYSALAQLSSEDKGLVDKKPAERKKLVSAITNSLETYNAIYKAVSKKSSSLKTLINSITSKIDLIGNETKIIATINNLDSQLSKLEEERQETTEAIAAVKIKISEYQKYLEENKYDDVISELKTVNRSVESSYADINSVVLKCNAESADKLVEFLSYINSQIASKESSLSSLKSQIPEMLAEREADSKDLVKKQQQLSSLQSEYNYTDLKNAISTTKSQLEEYESVFNQMGLNNINLITKDEYDSAMESISNLKKMANAMMLNYSSEDILYVINHRTECNAEVYSKDNYKITLDGIKSRISELSVKVALYQSKREIASELSNRPSNCKIDGCPYISSALKANKEYPESELNKLLKELDIQTSKVAEMQKAVDNAEKYSLIITEIDRIERELKSNMKFIRKLPVRKDFAETFLARAANYDSFSDIDALYKYVDCGNMIEQYKIQIEQYKTYESEYKLYESKNKIIESIIDDISNLQSKTSALAEKINDINQSILNIQTEIDDLKISKTTIEKAVNEYNTIYIPNKARKDELDKIKEALTSQVAEISDLNNKLNTLNSNLGAVNSDIKNTMDQKQALEHSLIMLNEYRKELSSYNKDYALIEKVKYYSSPTTGIQSVFIGMYMNKILSTANQLLATLFGGEFVLQPFIVNDTEFRIPCMGSGLMHDDISSMSTAQRSIISLIISFALLNQSSTKYNIISLDEMDGPLDTANRIGFVSLLDNLMNMLHCEQAFIISHNNELNTNMADIILLKDNMYEASSSSNIIWKY